MRTQTQTRSRTRLRTYTHWTPPRLQRRTTRGDRGYQTRRRSRHRSSCPNYMYTARAPPRRRHTTNPLCSSARIASRSRLGNSHRAGLHMEPQGPSRRGSKPREGTWIPQTRGCRPRKCIPTHTYTARVVPLRLHSRRPRGTLLRATNRCRLDNRTRLRRCTAPRTTPTCTLRRPPRCQSIRPCTTTRWKRPTSQDTRPPLWHTLLPARRPRNSSARQDKRCRHGFRCRSGRTTLPQHCTRPHMPTTCTPRQRNPSGRQRTVSPKPYRYQQGSRFRC